MITEKLDCIALAGALVVLVGIGGCASGGQGSGSTSRASLVERGAVRLDSSALKSLLSGASIAGPSIKGGMNVSWTFKPDGNVSGSSQFLFVQAGDYPQVGTWQVDADRLCVQLRAMDPSTTVAYRLREDACEEWYRLGSDHFAVQGGSAMVRKVSG